MIIARFIAFLRQNLRTGSARSLSTRTYTRARTYTHTCIHVAGTFPTGALVYVNCIRNSEYPANFLHTDHSRISAKRTSIRRSLHHKFRCTWCNAHLEKAPRVAFVMRQTSALLSPMLRFCPTDSRVFHVFVGYGYTFRNTIYRYYIEIQ